MESKLASHGPPIQYLVSVERNARDSQNECPQRNAVVNSAYVAFAGRGRGKPSPVTDAVVGGVVLTGAGKFIVFRGERETIDGVFGAAERADEEHVFVGGAQFGEDLMYLYHRSLILGVPLPPGIVSMCANRKKDVGEQQSVVDFSLSWGGARSTAPISARYYLNLFGFDVGEKKVGEVLCRIYRQVAGTIGYGNAEPFYSPLHDPMATDYAPLATPAINVARLPRVASTHVAFFQWLTKPLAQLMGNGPLVRGWGRLGVDTRLNYPTESGALDPTAVRICGFVAQSHDGDHYFFSGDEVACISEGMTWLEARRNNSQIYITEPTAWRAFTALRATVAGLNLPRWIFGALGKRWIASTSLALPAYDYAFYEAVLRYCVEHRALETLSGVRGFSAPVWFGQNNFEEESRAFCRTVFSFIATSPYLPKITASPL